MNRALPKSCLIHRSSAEKTGLYAFALKFICFSAVLCTFFEQYCSFIPGITLGELILIIASLLRIVTLRNKIQFKSTSPLIAYYFFGLLMTCISVLISQVNFTLVPEWEFASRLLRYLAIVLFFVLACDRIDKGFVLRLYRLLCIIVSIYILLQSLVYLLFNVYLPVKVLPFFEFSRAVNTKELLDLANNYYYRGCGPFAEPGYAAQFLLPGLAFSLYGWLKKDRSDLFAVILISFSVIVTTSVQGIVIGLLTVLVFTFADPRRRRMKKEKMKNWLLTLASISALAAVLYLKGQLDFPLERISGITLAKGDSTSLRLYRGFALWLKLPLLYKLIGVGFGNIANFIDTFNIRTAYDSYLTSVTATEYVNGISGVLICSGLLSVPFIVTWFVRLYKGSAVVGRIILFQLFLVLSSGSGVFTLSSLFFVLLLLTSVDSVGDKTTGGPTRPETAVPNQLIGEII